MTYATSMRQAWRCSDDHDVHTSSVTVQQRSRRPCVGRDGTVAITTPMRRAGRNVTYATHIRRTWRARDVRNAYTFVYKGNKCTFFCKVHFYPYISYVCCNVSTDSAKVCYAERVQFRLWSSNTYWAPVKYKTNYCNVLLYLENHFVHLRT